MTHTHLVLLGTSLLGTAAGLVGVFAVLRRQALLGDVLAHATLPGLVLAFLWAGGKNLEALLFGASLGCALAGGTLWLLGRYTRLRPDVHLGVVLSVFFGLGIALLGQVQDAPGAGQAGLESYLFGKPAGMLQRDLYWLTGVAGLCAIAVFAWYKELQLVAFDAEFAKAQGWPIGGLDFLLLGLVVLVVVIGLPVVGVVMVSALLIMPAAVARLWTNRLSLMVALAGAVGGLMGVLGTLTSACVPFLPAGPTIVLTGALFLITSLLCSPQRGLLVLWARRVRTGRWTQSDSSQPDKEPGGKWREHA
ncbi:MAG: iron chelate uptake ABC transporter family permease subunit [Gemmatales bacterium]|nr:metal ABC transporter permease [Gemmatales bacterium]MDW8175066.1 iron chelate uptake ABC transporter family permease subunit [Gemmatales bacterium]